MKLSIVARLSFGAAVSGALLAGCNGASSQSAAVPQAREAPAHHATFDARAIAMTNALGKVPVQHLNHGKSWIRPDAGKQWLLYVSDGSTGTIDIYNYRVQAGKLYGQITGLRFPYGQCVDRAGNVYIVDNATAQISEYAHGGITPIATASDDYGSPIGCSVDPTTGNVAVSNWSGTGSASGNVDVFAGGLSGSQTSYTDSDLYRLYPPGYDPQGNLYVQGGHYGSGNGFAELPAGSGSFTALTGLTIDFPGSVQWDGSYLAVTDQNYGFNYETAIYRVTVSGSAVTVVRKTVLTDDCYPHRSYMVAVQPFVTGTTRKLNAVAAGNLNCPSRQGFWNYANGADPKRMLPPAIAPVNPYGQSVSPPAT